MAFNELCKRAVLLIVDHLEGVAPLGHTTLAKSIDEAAAALVNVAKLYDIPIVVSGISMGTAPQLTPAVSEALRGAARCTWWEGTRLQDVRRLQCVQR